MEMVIILQTSLFAHSKIVELKKILSNFFKFSIIEENKFQNWK